MLQHPFATIHSGRLSTVRYAGFGTKNNVKFNSHIDDIRAENPNIVVSVKTTFRPDTRLLYWAANPQTRQTYRRGLTGERRAFYGFGNTGTTRVGDDGWVSCRLATPRPYMAGCDGATPIGRHLYLRRASYSRPDTLTETLYAASCLPAMTPARRVIRIGGANPNVLNVFSYDPPVHATVANSLVHMRQLSKSDGVNDVNLFLRFG